MIGISYCPIVQLESNRKASTGFSCYAVVGPGIQTLAGRYPKYLTSPSAHNYVHSIPRRALPSSTPINALEDEDDSLGCTHTVHALERGLSSTYDIRTVKCWEHNDGMEDTHRGNVVGGPGKVL